MSKYQYTEIEKQLNKVLLRQERELKTISFPDTQTIDARISESESLLTSLGYQLPKRGIIQGRKKPIMVVPSWERLCCEAEKAFDMNVELEDIFTDEELKQNSDAIKLLNRDYKTLHHLDKHDIAISAVAGIVGAAIDILMVGIPKKTHDGISTGTLSDFIRSRFEKLFPKEEMKKLTSSDVSKTPFDAQDNRHTKEYVNGLSAYYHRLLSLGHDPLLGFVVGVFDILTGRMTTIDKTGRFISQIMENYTDRKESNIFAALAKQIIHFKSDITTSMGLPVPFMALFNFLQFGSIGEENQTIAEIVQGMYYEGYDFIHFCSMTVPAMLVEVIIRLGYAIKRIKEGYPVKDSIPVSLNREKHPKLATMLFIGHAAATAINAGKVYFTHNPLAINYPQWLAFAKYSYSQLKWTLIQKPELQDQYITGRLNEELSEVLLSVDQTFNDFSKDYIVVME
ncbi:MAG: hypothetical protein K5766_01345 [Alphaproteobacteria bacterium]|nr:hypothetical protein [Alphaproteobacteria bacterium]